MSQLNRFQNFMVRICRITLFDVNQALWDRYHAGKKAGIEIGRKEKSDCMRCALWRADQLMAGAYDDINPTTEGKIHTEGIRSRALKRSWLEHPGTLMKDDKQMREQRKRATEDGPSTEIVPKVPRFTTVKLQPLPPI